MATATLDAPLSLSTLQATKLVIRSAHFEFGAGAVQIRFDMVDASGAVVDQRNITVQGGVVATYVANQEATIYSRLLAFLGVTGTVA
jgi:hypothetical protein